MLRYLCLFYILYIPSYVFATPPRVEKGVLDLRNWNWEQQGVVHLDGEWEWYWQQLYPSSVFATSDCPKPTAYIPVPDTWNDYVQASWWQQGIGYATYRLRVLLPPSQKILGLKVLTVSTALNLYINGRQVGQVGKVGREKEEMIPVYHPFMTAWQPETDTLEIVAHVSNFYYRKGGLWNTFVLGTNEDVQDFRLQILIRDFFLIGSFLLIGLYHLAVYLFLPKRLQSLFFGLFCISIVIRIFSTGEYASVLWINWNWEWLVRVEYLSWFLGTVVFIFFSQQLFPQEFSKRLAWWTTGIWFVVTVLSLLLPARVFTYFIPMCQVYLLLSGMYFLTRYIQAFKQGRNGSLSFLIGSVVFFICCLNDILFSVYIIQTGHFFYVGIFVFVFAQAISLSQQFSTSVSDLEVANQELEVLNEELKAINEELTQKGQDVAGKNIQLQQLNANLDSVMHRVSHDLRSPIASVLGLIGLIQDEKDIDQIQTYVGLQEKTLHRMDRLIQDIIDYSKNKNTELALEFVDFQNLIEEIFQDHEYIEAASRIEQRIEVEQEGLFVSDARRLTIVLSNLLSNAIRYHNPMNPHPFIRIQVEAKSDNAFIQVSDNGQGIGKEHLDKIFGMFYRASEQTKGSGLGLYIVKEAIGKFQGSIEVESALGKGTVFRIILPNLAAKLAMTPKEPS